MTFILANWNDLTGYIETVWFWPTSIKKIGNYFSSTIKTYLLYFTDFNSFILKYKQYVSPS